MFAAATAVLVVARESTPKARCRVCSTLNGGLSFLDSVHLRENKSITIDPVGVVGVESHELVEEDVGNRCHTHGRAGMPGVGFEGGIDLRI